MLSPPPGLSPTYLSNKYMTLALINENTKRKFGSYYLDPPPTYYSLTWAYINGTTYLTNNPSRSPSSNLFLVWKNGVQHKGQNKIIVECAYIPMLVSWSSWKVNKVICIPHWSGTNIRTCPHKGISKTQQSKTTTSVLGTMQYPSCSYYLSFYNISHTNLGSQLNAYGVGMNVSMNQMTKRLVLDLSYMVV
jgi:hypothetical protein